ncbi:alcohol dehydrogenase catalytic domain-containing protein [Streptomyces sp. R35]|uniref:Alcohol dehydrogenase catalytic domain-containing protein n=1 Tax=Streptomyces sp. R35 TaxID=3238630 RepID=A0AB39RW39_9ACTN
MRATLIYGAGDVRVDEVSDPKIQKPTDAVVRVLRSCVCGSDLWPYGSMPASEHGGGRIGHEFLGVVEDSALLPSLLPLSDVFCTGHHCAVTAGVNARTTVTVVGDGTHTVLECVGTLPALEMLLGVVRAGGTVSRVGAPQYGEVPLDDVPEGYRAMAGREALKVLIQP